LKRTYQPGDKSRPVVKVVKVKKGAPTVIYAMGALYLRQKDTFKKGLDKRSDKS